jgi:hypothetical protein
MSMVKTRARNAIAPHCISCNGNSRPSRSQARASAEVMDRCIDVPVPSVSVKTDGPPMVQFTANNNRCSDMIAHLIVDGREWDPTGLARSTGWRLLHSG